MRSTATTLLSKTVYSRLLRFPPRIVVPCARAHLAVSPPRSFSTSCRLSTADTTGPTDPKKLLIVYYSRTDGARQMAQAAYEGALKAQDSGVVTELIHASKAGPDDLLAASGYIFATPENLAAVAGIFKDFMDRSCAQLYLMRTVLTTHRFYPVLGKLNGRPYAVMICAGSDGQNAMRQVDRCATGWRLKKATDGIIVCTHAQTAERCLAMKTIEPADLQRCAEIGEALAEGMALGVF